MRHETAGTVMTLCIVWFVWDKVQFVILEGFGLLVTDCSSVLATEVCQALHHS